MDVGWLIIVVTFCLGAAFGSLLLAAIVGRADSGEAWYWYQRGLSEGRARQRGWVGDPGPERMTIGEHGPEQVIPIAHPHEVDDRNGGRNER